jgi:hypothetical protein
MASLFRSYETFTQTKSLFITPKKNLLIGIGFSLPHHSEGFAFYFKPSLNKALQTLARMPAFIRSWFPK